MKKGSMHRKDFLRILAGVPALGAVISQATSPSHGAERADAAGKAKGKVDEDKTAAFVDRVTDDVGRTMLGALSYIGDRLGLFKTMAGMGKFTARDLARTTGYNERLLHEWLKGMVSIGYVLYHSAEERFSFPPEHAAVLADEDSPFFMGGMVEYAIPAVLATHQVMGAFRTGVPITPDVFHANIWEGIERWTTPMYKHQLVQNWLPLMPDVFERLKAGAAVADVGCGSGRAMITIAKAFAMTKTRGFDVFEPSIQRARKNAQAEGVADRATFVVGGSDELGTGQFDLITNFWVAHHYSRPVKEMQAIRRALAPNGSYLIAEDRLSSDPSENVRPLGRVGYGASTLACLHDSMADNGAGLGLATEDDVRRIGGQAGFQKIRKLPLDDPYVALYELKG